MAVQQNKVSKHRKRKRRSHDKITAVQVGRCPRCNDTIRPHTICETCGHYRGMAYLPVDEF